MIGSYTSPVKYKQDKQLQPPYLTRVSDITFLTRDSYIPRNSTLSAVIVQHVGGPFEPSILLEYRAEKLTKYYMGLMSEHIF